MVLAFYNSECRAIASLDKSDYIYLFNGSLVGRLSGDFIYSLSDKKLGWLEDGFVNDMNGKLVFFVDNATADPPRINKSSLWSELSNESFFSQ